jgi:ABC-2 type transport system permease protein
VQAEVTIAALSPRSAPDDRRASRVVASRTARRAARSGVVWGYVIAAVVATSALGYATAYKTPSQRDSLARTFGSNAGLAALAGPARDIQTLAGYTVWKVSLTTTIVGAVWGLLLATKLLRGEEESGRWEMLLAGATTRRRAAAQAMAGLGSGLLVLWAVTAAATVVVGRSSKIQFSVGGSLYFSISLVCGAAMFLAAGALCSQLAATRRQAAAYAGGALGAAYAIRLVADSGSGLSWLRWASPLGWVEELRPLTGPRPFALVPIAALVVLLTVLTVQLAGTRDLNSGVLADRMTGPARTSLLEGQVRFILRLARPTLLAWAAGLAAMAMLLGLVAKQAGGVISASSTVEKLFSRLGAHGTNARAYLGFVFLILAVMLAFVAAGQTSAARNEEAEGRLENLLVRPLSRSSWFSKRVAVGMAAVVCGGLLSGLFAWFGAASQGAEVSLPSLLAAGLNVSFPAIFVVGIGALALGVAPRAVPTVTYTVLAWSFLVDTVGGVLKSNRLLLDTSVFHQITAAPAVSPNWVSAAALGALGAASAVVGGIVFVRRDLAGQ